MNKKLVLTLTCIAWTATYHAVPSQELINGFTELKQYLKQASSKFAYKNIFMDMPFQQRVEAHRVYANNWLNEQLKRYRSDTLSGIYDRVTYRSDFVIKSLKDFSMHIDEMNMPESLRAYQQKAADFAHERDNLRKELQAGSTLNTFKTHAKPFFRTQAREFAKQEIADVLIAYTETFAQLAQKAVTDFAYLDAEMFQQEQTPNLPMILPALKDMPQQPSGLMNEEKSFTKALDLYDPSLSKE